MVQQLLVLFAGKFNNIREEYVNILFFDGTCGTIIFHICIVHCDCAICYTFIQILIDLRFIR